MAAGWVFREKPQSGSSCCHLDRSEECVLGEICLGLGSDVHHSQPRKPGFVAQILEWLLSHIPQVRSLLSSCSTRHFEAQVLSANRCWLHLP